MTTRADLVEPVISIVVPTFNRASTLGETIDALLAQRRDRFRIEVVVVDNGSSDETPDVLAEYEGRIVALHEGQPGESFARNCGIRAARGDWIALIDDDETAATDWLQELMLVARGQSIPIVAGVVLADLDSDLLEELGPICRRLLGQVECDEPHRLEGMDVPGTGNVLISKSVFETIGLFNEQMTVASDSEFFIRARQAGFQMWRTPGAIATHRIPESRLQEDYFRSRVRWQGSHFVRLESQGSRLRALYLGVSRFGASLLINLPQWLWYSSQGRSWHALGHEVRVRRGWACMKEAILLLAPSAPAGSLARRVWDILRRASQSEYPVFERIHSVAEEEFLFRVACPEAEEWYVRGAGARACRPDLSFWKERLVRPGDLVFDCGGFQGFTTLFLSRCVGPKGQVVTFEINQKNAAVLAENLALNEIENVRLENSAVGSSSEDVAFMNRPNGAVLPRNGSWVGLLQSWAFGRAKARQTTLDGFCQREELWPTFVKIDVEGYEVEVLKGAGRLLATLPGLAIELHPQLLARRGQRVEEVFPLLQPFGYELWVQWKEDLEPEPYRGESITHRTQLFAVPPPNKDSGSAVRSPSGQ